MNDREKMLAVISAMRGTAAEIAKADINGFGNAVSAQADYLEALLTEPTLEEVLALLNNITLNAQLVSLNGATDIYAVPLDDIEAARECLRRVKE